MFVRRSAGTELIAGVPATTFAAKTTSADYTPTAYSDVDES